MKRLDFYKKTSPRIEETIGTINSPSAEISNFHLTYSTINQRSGTKKSSHQSSPRNYEKSLSPLKK